MIKAVLAARAILSDEPHQRDDALFLAATVLASFSSDPAERQNARDALTRLEHVGDEI